MLRLNQSKLNSEFCWVDSKNLVSAPEFLRQVSSARQILQAKGERLALCFNDSYAFAVSLLAGLSLNKKLIILPNNKTATLELFRNEYDQIICDEDFLKWIPAARPEDLEIDLHAKIVFFTSGSSGVSKKIEKRFENIYAELKNLDETFSPRLLGSTVIATVSHQHIYGFLFKVLWPILFKRTWVNTPIEYPEMILNYSAKLESFCLISTPRNLF